jgi:hypothetical protein
MCELRQSHHPIVVPWFDMRSVLSGKRIFLVLGLAYWRQSYYCGRRPRYSCRKLAAACLLT